MAETGSTVLTTAEQAIRKTALKKIMKKSAVNDC
jgi:hypothetical protein